LISLAQDIVLTNNPVPLRSETEGDVRRVYWFAGKSFLGVCDAKQALPWKPTAGTYQLTALDDHGRSVSAKVTLR